MANTRVQELMEMIKNTTDPDQLAILKFDLDEAMGRKDSSVKKGVKKRSGGGNSMTDSQKKFASLAKPKDKITYADKIAGATKKNNKVRSARHGGSGGGGNYGGDEVMAAKRCKGGGIAVKGTGFKGTF